MKLATVILFSYLLFPQISDQQKNMIYYFGKEQMEIEEEEQLLDEMLEMLFPDGLTDEYLFAVKKSLDEKRALTQTAETVSDEASELPEKNGEGLSEKSDEQLPLSDDNSNENPGEMPGAGLIVPEQSSAYDSEKDIIFDEEDVPLPDGLENPEFEPQSPGSELLEKTEKKVEQNSEKLQSAAEKQYLNSMNRLRLFTYGDEQFSLNQSRRKNRETITVNDEKIIRCTYNDAFLLTEKITWKNAETLKASEILAKTQIKYVQKDGKYILSERTDEKKSADKTPVRQIIETGYDAAGNPVKTVYSHYAEKKENADSTNNASEKNNDSKKASENSKTQPDVKSEGTGLEKAEETKKLEYEKITDRTVLRKFDGKNRVTSEEELIDYEIPDPVFKGQKNKATYSRKNEYVYTEKCSLPDYSFYENSFLRMKTVYVNEKEYDQTIYFENNYSVFCKYKDGKKVTEAFYAGTELLKRNSFE